MCWVALDRAVNWPTAWATGPIATAGPRRATPFGPQVLEQAWSEKAGAYTGAFGSDDLDASVLLLPVVGFLPGDDPRMRETVEAIERGAGAGRADPPLAQRRERLPDLHLLAGRVPGPGRQPGARQDWFDGAVRYANDLGLLSEEADPRSGELLGNFPQAFSHVGLINAAWRLGQPAAART
jgi:GH15 family glucan-1,4-alpha-glucosidase